MRERKKGVLVTILAVSIKEEPPNPLLYINLSFAMATKKKKKESLNRFSNGDDKGLERVNKKPLKLAKEV